MKVMLLTLVYLGLGLLRPLSATPISFTETGRITGTLAGTAFTNALFSLVATGNTADATTFGPGFPGIVPLSATLTIQGFAPVVPNFTFVILNSNGTVSLVDAGSSGFAITSSSLQGWPTTTSIGPIVGTGRANGSVPNSGGSLLLTRADGDFTFQAVVAPEPSTGMLAGILIVILLCLSWREGGQKSPDGRGIRSGPPPSGL